MSDRLFLSEPVPELKDAFLEMVVECQASGMRYAHHQLAQNDFAAYLAQVDAMRCGLALPPGWVPMTTFWLVQDGAQVLGESRLRHVLNPALEVEGGHIGYMIRPAARRQGYGTLILALTLEEAGQRGLKRVLVTCDTDNTASARIIEKNGGILASYETSPRGGVQISRYWIELASRET
jgi:predicted acetyltransferase